jgi:predicted amidophosphoribosyltransferase
MIGARREGLFTATRPMIAINPIPLAGPWDEGFALDLHTVSSQYLGDDAYGNPQFDTRRSPVGELVFQLKYRADKTAAAALCETAAAFVRGRRWAPDLVVPAPPSRAGRRFQPVPVLAEGVGKLLGCPGCEDCVAKVKATAELKSVYDYRERLEKLKDAYSVQAAKTAGRAILLVDDLYRSGATLEALAGALRTDGRAGKIFALTFTRTRSNR